MNKETAVYICLDLICRERITQYLAQKMPDMEESWKVIRRKFHNREKMQLNTWAGDLFAKVANEYCVSNYDELAEKQFARDIADN